MEFILSKNLLIVKATDGENKLGNAGVAGGNGSVMNCKTGIDIYIILILCIQNNKVNGNGIILISNYLKRKWVECSNQKTKTG